MFQETCARFHQTTAGLAEYAVSLQIVLSLVGTADGRSQLLRNLNVFQKAFTEMKRPEMSMPGPQ